MLGWRPTLQDLRHHSHHRVKLGQEDPRLGSARVRCSKESAELLWLKMTTERQAPIAIVASNIKAHCPDVLDKLEELSIQ